MNKSSTDAHFVQMDVYDWIEKQGGIVDRTKSGLQLERGQVVIVIEAIIGEQRISIRKLVDDYPDKVKERIKETILNINHGGTTPVKNRVGL